LLELENILIILIIVTILSLVLSFSIITFLFLSNKKDKVLNSDLDKKFSDLKQQNTILRSEIDELRGGLLNMGKRILQQEQVSQELSQNQQELQFSDPDSKMYSRAVKMVELGAQLDEVMKECELPRAEAELLLSLHQQK
jgi:cell division protein FtsB